MVTIGTFGSKLTDDKYAKYHQLRKQASTMDELQLKKFNEITSELNTSNLQILSIGSGTGNFDVEVIRPIAGQILKYVCIEPLAEHLDSLRANLLTVLTEDQIEIHHGTAETFTSTRKFDLIHNVHVIHWINNPVEVLKKLQGLLTSEGKSVTVVQSELGMPRLYKQLKPSEAGSLTAETLFRELEQYELSYLPAKLNVTEIVKASKQGKRILQFVISSKLNEEQFRAAIPVVQQLSEETDGVYSIAEPMGVLTYDNSTKR